jgi:hypothetical protein
MQKNALKNLSANGIFHRLGITPNIVTKDTIRQLHVVTNHGLENVM